VSERDALLASLAAQVAGSLEALVYEIVQEELAAQQSVSSNGTTLSPYMSVEEAADYMRADRQRIYDLCSSGRLTRHKDGTRVLVRRDEVETQFARNR
jgi:excisionase family DNA binding protein